MLAGLIGIDQRCGLGWRGRAGRLGQRLFIRLGRCHRLGIRDRFLRLGREQATLGVAKFLKFFDAGQLGHVVEAKAEQELLGRLIEDGPADDLFAACGTDELAIEQGPITPEESTPRISLTSGTVTGCL